jgi:hypothetical protein
MNSVHRLDPYDNPKQKDDPNIIGLNRFYRITDYGLREKAWAADHAKEMADTAHNLTFGPVTRSVMHTYFRLRAKGHEHRNQREQAQYEQLATFYTTLYKPIDQQILDLEKAGNKRIGMMMRKDLEKSAEVYRKRLQR